MNPDQHSFEAVAIYKKELDKSDPFLIYKVNDGKMNNMPDFVFKSAKDMLLLAAEMDQSGEQNPMQQEAAYFDGSHSRCVGFKTLGLFVLHPGMRCLVRLASMEVRTESTKNIAMFWKLFNEALSEATGKPGTIFNPYIIMVDENGANFCGVKEEFGLEYAIEKLTSCQLHFKKDLLKQLSNIGESYRDEFYQIGCQLCSAPTVAKYNELQKLLLEFADIFPAIKPWLDFWDARKYHVFPAFRRFGYTGVTLAESGNAQIKRSTSLWLLDATKDDTTTMIIQCANLQKYKEQTQVDIGSLASNQVNRAAHSRNQQLSMAKAYVQELQNPDHWQQHLEEHNSPGIFIPGGNAKHKAGRGTGIQGSYVGVGRAKETNIVRGRGRGTGRGRGRGRPLKPNNSSSIDDVMRRGEELLKNRNNPTASSGENTCTNYDPKTNPPNIALFLGLSISRCQGCRGVIDRKVLQSPKDIAIRVQRF